ncbi:hypothetical protein [Streptosporangium subroseum]|nr:hypothetical protein OHB15_15810 [Streptosporangium subroseum]
MSDVIQLELDHILVTSDAGGRLMPNAGMTGPGGRNDRPGAPRGGMID